MSDQLNVRLSIKPHDMDTNLVRVLLVSSVTIKPSGGSENVQRGIEQLSGIDHVVHVGKRSTEVYVVEGELARAFEGLFHFIAIGAQAKSGDLQIIYHGESFAFDYPTRYWVQSLWRLRSDSSAQRPA